MIYVNAFNNVSYHTGMGFGQSGARSNESRLTWLYCQIHVAYMQKPAK